MSAESDAYAAAEKAIADALESGQTRLVLSDLAMLTRLPPEISELTQLKELRLGGAHQGTRISDIGPLHSLTALQSLELCNTRVADISPLKGMNVLKRLILDDTLITNITPLQDLNALQTLFLNNTHVTDISPLQGLNELQSLELNNSHVTDIAPLRALIRLQVLYLDNTYVTDIIPLQGLIELQALHLDDLQISDITPLQELTGLLILFLNNTRVTNIAPLQGLTKLNCLQLDNSHVTDIATLQNLVRMSNLNLNNTQITDIAPLRGLTALQALFLDNTPVLDFRPLTGLPLGLTDEKYPHSYYRGLHFKNTAATRSSSDLFGLSQVKDNETRTRDTLAYLKTLPPWPAPLPWDIPPETQDNTPPAPLKPDTLPRILLTPDKRIDLGHSPATELDISDPIKARLYARLPVAVQTLVRFGNRYEFLPAPANALRDLVAVPFGDADLLDIHLEIAVLTDIKEADPKKPEAERMDADCRTALDAVLRLGPPITMGHPDVDLFEKRSLEFARTRRAATTAEAERQVVKGLANAPEITTERLRDTSQILAASQADNGRVADYRASFTRNTIITMAYVAETLSTAATGVAASGTVIAAAQFLILHMDAIMAVAPAWGETGYKWAEYLMIRANQIVEDAREGK